MKLNKKIIACIVALIMILNFSVTTIIPVFSHDVLLDVIYDECVADEENDGIEERWYVLEENSIQKHISNETDTIKYYFKETQWDDIEISALDNMTPFELQCLETEIKNACIDSIEKWNNVYFYSYNADGTITKKKVINIIAGTAADHNLGIMLWEPPGNPNSKTSGSTVSENNSGQIQPDSVDTTHIHASYWEMKIYIPQFYVHGSVTIDIVNENKERTGAHEIGHVLGLQDIDTDNLCGGNANFKHHNELLMGYGEENTPKCVDITYKDIAGVAITRGFHTDEDHRWLTTGALIDGEYKLICSICNGVKYVESLTEYPHDMYMYCEGDHELSDGNMMAVASYGNQDYYKCKYCRYVAPFSDIVEQDYTKTNFSTYLHKYVNNVEGLEYTFYEAHQYNCVSLNRFSHQSTCDCGETKVVAHYIYGSEHAGEDYAPCAGCGYMLDLENGIYESIMSITQVSINGSYIRSDGIVVLVDEDIEAYLAGTLQFYHPEDVPVTQ